MDGPVLRVEQLGKGFTLHNQGGASYRVLCNLDLEVARGECVVLVGESGAGKSTLLRCLYANYQPDSGSILLHDGTRWNDLHRLSDRALIRVRRQNIAYVSQFLRVIPRVPALDIVMQPMLELGFDRSAAEQRAAELLNRLRIPRRLWSLSPTTFSGGEQQRVNIAREFTVDRPLMLLDEPTASLDEHNRNTVIDLIVEAKIAGCAIVGIFHDEISRNRVADRLINVNAKA